ncbi:hypothetical protein PG985_010668 [Apiospora marii]|uniref:Uncharacterized protein n=1 Tax=Apiospora marii TaxID=335849 RepID=A0ABR1T1L0_9PEZI
MLSNILLAAGLAPAILAKPIQHRRRMDNLTETATSTEPEPEFTAVLDMPQKRARGPMPMSTSVPTSSTDDFIIYGSDLPTQSEFLSVPTITMRRSRTLTVPLSLETDDGLELPTKKRAVGIPSLTDDLVLPTVTDAILPSATVTDDILPSATVTDDLPLETDDLDPDLLFMHKRAMALPSVTTDDVVLPTETDDLLPSLTLTDDIPLETDDLDLGFMNKRSIVVPSVTDDLDLPTMTASILPSLTLSEDLPLQTEDLDLDFMNKRAALSVTDDMLLPTETESFVLPSLTVSVTDLPLETDDLDLPLDTEEKRDMMKLRPSSTSSSYSRSHSSSHSSSRSLPSPTISLLDLPQETDDLDLPFDTEEKRDMMNHRPTHSLSRFSVVVPSATSLFPSSSNLLPLPVETAVDPDLDFDMHKNKRQEEEEEEEEFVDERVKPAKPTVSLPTASKVPTPSVSGVVLPKPSVTGPPQVHDHCSDCGTKCAAVKDVAGILKCVQDCVAHCLSHLPTQTGSVVVNSLSMSK